MLYNGQIKQFVTILENSLEMRHAAKHQSRPLKDDRNVSAALTEAGRCAVALLPVRLSVDIFRLRNVK